MDPKLLAAITVGKITKKLVKIRNSGGTAAPGLFSLYLDKNALKKLSEPLDKVIFVSGTNGKTTTTRLIGNLLSQNKVSFIHNRHGSNLERGLLSAILENSSLQGSLSAQTALFEVDEAALASVISKVVPSVIVLTSLFRDQLDRYGEVDNIKRLWEKALQTLPESTKLVLNADDPYLADLGQKVKNEVIYFGINDTSAKLSDPPKAVDISKCPNCNSELLYKHYYISHQGDYYCQKCPFKRPELDIEARGLNISDDTIEFLLKDTEFSIELKTNLAGVYNVYNILASYGGAKALGLNLDEFPLVLKDFAAVFGRGEKIALGNKQILVTLAKNPTGFNEIIRTFLKKEAQTILIAINDKIADGRDVSWLWDVDFELLAEKKHRVIVSGIRANEMGLRLKYAGFNDFEVIESLPEALDLSLQETPETKTLTIIPTYTAMLELKNLLAKRGISGEFWED